MSFFENFKKTMVPAEAGTLQNMQKNRLSFEAQDCSCNNYSSSPTTSS